MVKKVYTFFLDYKGGTYISQITSREHSSAIGKWGEDILKSKVTGLTKRGKLRLVDIFLDQNPQPIDGMNGVFCLSGHVEGSLTLLHYVECESSSLK